MREPLFTPRNQPARGLIIEGDPESRQKARLSAALHRAINLAIESAFRYGVDLPVGAVALQSEEIIGRGFAGDMRFGQPQLHAEIMALLDTRFDVQGGKPDTVVVSTEPCVRCQDNLAGESSLKRVAFGLSRKDLSDKGLIRSYGEDIFERAERVGLPYEITRIEDNDLRLAGLTIFDHVTRDPGTGLVEVNPETLNEALMSLNEHGPSGS
jgi:pyrimidine deaminase RibD-like protein